MLEKLFANTFLASTVVGIPRNKTDKSSKGSRHSERSMEEAQEQTDIVDFGDTFLAGLYSTRLWNDAISVKPRLFHNEENHFLPFPESCSSVYSVVKESIVTQEPRDIQLKVVKMYLEKDTPFEWTDEYMELDLKTKIEAYNSVARGMEITLYEDGVIFGGHIQVYMDLNQPIYVVDKTVPQPVYDVVNTAKSIDKSNPTIKITPLIFPQKTTQVVDIVSKTTVRQMIVKLFKKLRTVNYPRRYALYEYERQIDETAGTLTKKLTRIADDACPLKVVLNWPIPHSDRALVLMEKDSTVASDEVLLRDVFISVTGLRKAEVDIRTRTNLQTGWYDATISKRDASIVLRVLMFISFFLVFILAFASCYSIYTDAHPRE